MSRYIQNGRVVLSRNGLALENVQPEPTVEVDSIRMFNKISFLNPESGEVTKGKIVALLVDNYFLVDVGSPDRVSIPGHCIRSIEE